MKTIYLHIGRPKTGSKSIQAFLSKNKDCLETSGILYPLSGREGDIHHPFFWSHWLRADTKQRAKFINSRQQIIDELTAEIRNSGAHKIILSSEDAFIASSIDYANSIKNSLSEFDLKVIVYIRRQDHIIESSYNQEIKLAANLVNEPFEQFKKRRNKFMDYYSVLKPWVKVFGKENIVIRVFEKEQMPNGLLDDFLDVLDIHEHDKYTYPEKPLNRPLVPEALEFKRIINGLSVPNNIIGLILPKIVQYSASILENMGKDFLKHSLLSSQDRIIILSEYEASNKKVAFEYMDREDSRLFYEQIEFTENQDILLDEDENSENLTRLLGYIIITLEQDMRVTNQRLNRQLNRINELEEKIKELSNLKS